MNWMYIVSFLVGGIILSLICNELLLRFSKSLGIRNKNDVVIRWSNESKPSLGGVSFFVVFVFATFAYAVFEFKENIFHELSFVGLFLASSLAFGMGLADDAYNTRPYSKLFIQIICGGILFFTGTQIDLFHVYWLDMSITVLFVVIVMNSLNMLDNMDGITGTTVFFILAACLVSHWMINGWSHDEWSLSLLAVLGAILGFLRFNINPSKLFMGDAGSQFIGLFTSFFGVKCLWNIGNTVDAPSWIGILLTLIIFTPAAADTLTVVINRLMRGQSPMVGGKDHTTHHLVYSGLKDFQVWVIFTLIGLGSFLIGVVMMKLVVVGKWSAMFAFIAYFIVVFLVLYRTTKVYKSPIKVE